MNESQDYVYEFDNFRLCPAKRLLLKGVDEIVPLMPKALDTLLFLVENSGKTIAKDELLSAVWADTIVEENNLTQNVSILRRVLGEKHGENRFIATVPGHGYKFVAEVRKVRAAASAPDDPETAESKDADDKPRIEDRKSGKRVNRFVVAGLIVFVVFALGTAGAYLWRASSRSEGSAAEPKVKTVAVLPFKPLVADDRNEALELGMADALISKLGGDDEIVVRPLTSVRRYAALEQNSQIAGRELGADIVLDGTIQMAGERIRVSARLVRVSDGKQLWAGQFDEKFTDIFAVQDSISERAAAVLKMRLVERRKNRRPESIEAYGFYMKGRFHVLKAVRSDIETGISYFQQAIAADPNYALAYVGLADAYRAMSLAGEMPAGDFWPKAKTAADRAIEIDDQSAEAHAVLGSILFWYDWDWKAAEDQYRRALALDSNSADAHQFYAHLLSNTGRHAEALSEIKRAVEIDPLNLRSGALEGMFLLHAGKIDEALTVSRKTLELDSNYWLANTVVSWIYLEKKRYAEVLDITRRQRQLAVVSEPVAIGAYALSKAGNDREARLALDDLLKQSAAGYVSPYNIALVYAALGDQEKALDNLEKGFAEKDVRMVFLKVDPKWEGLRLEPRFVELMRRMNFS
ncbi:MAG: winged helix-turn-helix domain-containing protein [Acidobacteria bacterium]|nr:winged helix-turn-helix domain-containing protein [Acidobacteriota bacterium]